MAWRAVHGATLAAPPPPRVLPSLNSSFMPEQRQANCVPGPLTSQLLAVRLLFLGICEVQDLKGMHGIPLGIHGGRER